MIQNSSNPKVSIIGLGGAGGKILKALSNIPGSKWLALGAVDTDELALNNIGIENAFSVGIEWNGGTGCGGNPTRAHRAFATDSLNELEKFISGSSMLVTIGGLGMGTATGGAPIIGRLAKRMQIPSIFIMSLPFAFEGQSKNEIAENGLRLIIPDVDIVIPIPNDILFSSINADIPVKHAFVKSDEAIARAALGLTETLRCKDLINIEFSELKELLGNKKTLCSIAIGIASQKDEPSRTQKALENYIDSPLINGIKSFQQADTILTTVISGDDFSMGELKETLESLNKLVGKTTQVIAGINTDPAYNGMLFITSLLLNYDKKEEIPKKEFKPKNDHPWLQNNQTKISEELIQPELLLRNFSRGYFAKTEQNLEDGEDIDVPPFQRKNITINTGI